MSPNSVPDNRRHRQSDTDRSCNKLLHSQPGVVRLVTLTMRATTPLVTVLEIAMHNNLP
jgi:hypothetical protein